MPRTIIIGLLTPTLQYQNSEYSDQLKPWTYEFEDGTLRIKPAFLLFTNENVS